MMKIVANLLHFIMLLQLHYSIDLFALNVMIIINVGSSDIEQRGISHVHLIVSDNADFNALVVLILVLILGCVYWLVVRPPRCCDCCKAASQQAKQQSQSAMQVESDMAHLHGEVKGCLEDANRPVEYVIPFVLQLAKLATLAYGVRVASYLEVMVVSYLTRARRWDEMDDERRRGLETLVEALASEAWLMANATAPQGSNDSR